MLLDYYCYYFSCILSISHSFSTLFSLYFRNASTHISFVLLISSISAGPVATHLPMESRVLCYSDTGVTPDVSQPSSLLFEVCSAQREWSRHDHLRSCLTRSSTNPSARELLVICIHLSISLPEIYSSASWESKIKCSPWFKRNCGPKPTKWSFQIHVLIHSFITNFNCFPQVFTA